MTLTPTPTLVHVEADETGQRLDRVLARHFADHPAALSRSRLKALIEAGAVVLDGKTIRDPSHRVKAGGGAHSAQCRL
jgi:23S rRNA pseudouridine1911/1915/1917 synthase